MRWKMLEVGWKRTKTEERWMSMHLAVASHADVVNLGVSNLLGEAYNESHVTSIQRIIGEVKTTTERLKSAGKPQDKHKHKLQHKQTRRNGPESNVKAWEFAMILFDVKVNDCGTAVSL